MEGANENKLTFKRELCFEKQINTKLGTFLQHFTIYSFLEHIRVPCVFCLRNIRVL